MSIDKPDKGSVMEDDSGFLSLNTPSPRRRSLSLEGHTNPFAGIRRGSGANEGRRPSSDSAPQSPGELKSTQNLLHSSLAGNLCYHTANRHRCFIDNSFVNHALEMLIIRNYGEEIWGKIQSVSEAHVASPFIVRMLYEDEVPYNTIDAICEVTGLSHEAVWEMVGEMFYDFCEECGYDKIIRVLGGSLKDFLQNLDALHDHLASVYQDMRAPSFRVTQRADGVLILHYYSQRVGLEHVVIGLVRAVARKLHNREVHIEIFNTQTDHVQFLISEKESESTNGETEKSETSDDSDEEVELLCYEPKISPATFCKAFPFHIMMNRDLKIIQAGQTVARIISELEDPSYTFRDIFQLVRPQIDLTFDDIYAHSNSVFVVRARDRIRLSPRRSVGNAQAAYQSTSTSRLTIPSMYEDCDITHRKQMCLKGEMMYLPESDRVVFLCSPSVGNLEDLVERGLYLSDIPLHDSTRDLILLSEQFRAEYELTQKLEIMNDKMHQTYRELEIEKQLTDKLVYSILPQSVANKLRVGEPVEAVKYDSVSILFSGMCDFNTFCNNNSPMTVVAVLNEIYTKFDALAEPRLYNVYKVETVGDKYMLASGLPEKSSVHAKNVAQVALDMLDILREISVDNHPVKVTIGIHSGEVVAGVVGQRLPHFAVFGNTVCLASRMESHGLPECINISEATYQLLQTKENFDEEFAFRSRGAIKVKGARAPMPCYVLSRNLRKLPKVHMLLENDLPLPPTSTSCSPSELSDFTFADSMRMRRHNSLRRPTLVPISRPHTNSESGIGGSGGGSGNTTDTLLGAALSLTNMLKGRRSSETVMTGLSMLSLQNSH